MKDWGYIVFLLLINGFGILPRFLQTLHMVGQELVQCLPLFTIARALNVRHIHLFSLDVEGAEMGILNTIPWNLLQFTVLEALIKQ